MKNKIIFGVLVSVGALALLSSCSSIPKKAKPVANFDVNRYLGTWYEIARFDYRFEKDLDNAIAQYSLNADGNVDVLNSGYNFKKEKWVSAKGLAKFRGDKKTAALKVSFFGPFYAGYNVIALDDDYKYALVAGKNLDYLWILSREKSIPQDIKDKYLKIAQEVGYNTSKLIWVKQDKKSPFENEK
ncbi:lipocalin family protein [Elizabethkingia meningoseptica]|uniref:lipocalin family protein n=1 Tax=Elizabethkingia meningoseptica TaxID=238 RepID=UPI0023B166CE|nr:lipocalin family protein [Elizabethkingia meningoseptica]MDE5437391.1 lipocalin family protein [Elizabethkingia meningoseptica]MDE5507511.1 lipocalin family protein [Elizabethkingia meningoseptica]MDE5515207.1 lipocalin family protein [Elizabethkingia meningoseptica]MDE5529473.1 lipocalin family protein [Elizabethkingia meningoseptica]MDE5533029.1 lipocalin family protein [Elizabethkingia meningoseptica]